MIASPERFGDWMQTYSGRQFWPMDPRADEIFIEDIAHHLSLLCRYGGACRTFYSVAEHSVLVARYTTPANRLWALLHDASEAYLVDVPRPIKPYLTGYARREEVLMRAVCRRFGLAEKMPAEVKNIDNRILTDERKQIMADPPVEWTVNEPALGVTLHCWSPAKAEAEFMQMFVDLTSKPDIVDAVALAWMRP